jgi:hypothetical protein
MSDYLITTYGAIGNGQANDTNAIQAAVDACAEAGGGRVVLPAPGVFKAGQFALKSNVELHVERGARLMASGNVDDYEDKAGVTKRAMIVCNDVENVAITGYGVIDGGDKHFIEEDLGHIYVMKRGRPFTFYLVGAKHLTMRDVTITNGALWTVRLTGCDDVVVHGIRILNDLKTPNNDAIDLDRCKNVRISDCHIEAGDDCICLKAMPDFPEYGACENVTVTGCTLVSTSGALMIGCEARSPMRNIIFDSCVIQRSHRGLAIHLSHECDVENVIFSNMVVETRLFHDKWWGRAEPIYVCAMPWKDTDGIGRVRHIRFSNILCRSENGVQIIGWEPGLIDDIVLENVRVELDKWSKWPGGQQDLRPNPVNGVIDYPTSGFFIKNARRVALRHCEVAWGENPPDYFRHALEAHGVEDLILEDFRGEAAHPGRFEAIVRD